MFYTPDATLHNALDDDVEHFNSKWPCSSGLAPNKCEYLIGLKDLYRIFTRPIVVSC